MPWWSKFPLCKLTVHSTPVSDHDPIQLDLLEVSIPKRAFRFKFENTWLKEPSFIKDVTGHWENIPPSHLLPKLMSVSRYMEKWGRNFFNKFKEKVKQQKALLDSLKDRSDDHSVRQFLIERDKLNEILLHEEIYWKQRAKLFWLKEGDENTKFFHAYASARKKTNRFSFLMTEEGTRVENSDDMCAVIHEYFSDVFAAPGRIQSSVAVASPRLVSYEQNLRLTEEVSFEEFTTAVHQMHPDKASGPDGLNPAFYQNFWKVMGKEVFDCCKDWLRGNSFPADLNHTNVVLIPKKENACHMKDLRPIALCNVLYKIVAKVLANRLKEVLPGLISEKQSAFVPGRSITDNVLVAFEIVHHLKRSRGGKEGEVALKLDISKAYDKVDWRYLKQRMQSLGFCSKWIEWIMRCVTTVSYDICFNGLTVGPITPRRGLRQGDPLSPYLFLFCVEGLSNLLDNASEEGKIHGCRISQTAPEVSHLLFADDSFLFFKATHEETTRIKGILEMYAEMSGQAINYQKSGVMYSSNVRLDKQLQLSTVLGVHNDISNSHYLGLPSLVGRSKKQVFGYLKERVYKRVQGWKAKPISRAGKSILIKNVAQSVPSYCMSCFLLPKSLSQEIERLFNGYWWNSGSTQSKGVKWLAWEGMSMSKSRGGLGFKSLYGFNIALLGKHIWKCIEFPDMLVSRVLKARYFPHVHVLEAVKGQGASFVWTGLWQAKEILCRGFRWVVGDGQSIVATKDPWLAMKKDYKVENLQRYEGRREVVSSLFHPGTKTWDSEKAILATFVPQRLVGDRIVWSKSNDGLYTVKTGYRYWHDQYIGDSVCTQSVGWNKLWRLPIPHKMKIFLWRFCRNNIPVRNRLRHKGVPLTIICPMCNIDVEHLLHVFFDCNFARSCWHAVGLSYDMSEVFSAPEWLLNKLQSSSQAEVIKISTVLWGIWFWRNRRVWEEKVINPVIAMETSCKNVQEWRGAKDTTKSSTNVENGSRGCGNHRWRPPEQGTVKVNVDASVFPQADKFTVGMVIRDHTGAFIEAKTLALPCPATVLEAESIGVKEALAWVMQRGDSKVVLETDSLLTVKAILNNNKYLLEVGHVIEHCRMLLKTAPGFSVNHIRKQSNKVAHGLARIPCLINCFHVFTSPPPHMLETFLNDLSNE